MKSRKILMYASLSFYLLLGCKKSFTDKIFDGINVSVNANSFLSHQVHLQFANANPESAVMPTITNISVSGRDSREVYDINGKKSIVIEDNYSQLVVSPGQIISTPKIFDVTVEALGFLPLTKRITITPRDSMSIFTFLMIEEANAPKGIVIKEENIDLSNLAAVTPSIVSNAINSETEQRLKMDIPVGTKFLDEGRNELSSVASAKIVHYNTTTPEIKALIPENIHCTNKRLIKNGTEADDATFIPLSMIDVQVQASGKNVSSFSTPLKANVELSNNTYNYVTSNSIVEGDPISIYRKDAGDDNWSFESDAVIKKNAEGKLYVDFNVLTTGRYITMAKGGPKAVSCGNNLVLTFTRPSNVNTLHTIEIREGNGKGNRVMFAYDQVPIFNGSTFTLPDKLPSGKSISVYVYELDFVDSKGRLLNATTTLPACPSAATIPINPPGLTNFPILRFNITVKCFDFPSLSYYHQGRVSFRPNNTGRFFSMGISRDGILDTDRLQFNKNYDYRTTISQKPQGSTSIRTRTYTKVGRPTYQLINSAGQVDIVNGSYPNLNGLWPNPDLDIRRETVGWFIPVVGENNTWIYYRLLDNNGTNIIWFAPEDACNDYNY